MGIQRKKKEKSKPGNRNVAVIKPGNRYLAVIKPGNRNVAVIRGADDQQVKWERNMSTELKEKC